MRQVIENTHVRGRGIYKYNTLGWDRVPLTAYECNYDIIILDGLVNYIVNYI